MLNIDNFKAPVYSLFKTNNTFIQYFENELPPNEARHSHESKLLLQELMFITSKCSFKSYQEAYILSSWWMEKKKFGSINAPLPMLQEKISTYAKIGKYLFGKYYNGYLFNKPYQNYF